MRSSNNHMNRNGGTDPGTDRNRESTSQDWSARPDSVAGSVRTLRAVPSVVAAPSFTVPPTARQLVVILPDGSGSMGMRLARPGSDLAHQHQTRAQAVAEATERLLADLKKSSLAANFSIAWFPWATEILHSFGPEPLTGIPEGRHWDPMQFGTGGNQMALPLDLAARTARDYMAQAMQEVMPSSAVILLLTDGEEVEFGDEPAIRAGNELRSIEGVTLAGCHFGESASHGHQLLQKIVTPGFYQAAHNAEELRAFFLKSVTLAGPPRLLPGSGH